MDFYQDPPKLANQFAADQLLRGYLEWRLPKNQQGLIFSDLNSFGAKVTGEMLELAWEAERQPPVHVPFDPWGKRIDQIVLSPAWQKMGAIAATEGIVALGYERTMAEWSRLYQLVKLYLYHPSSALFSCPLAMTDGAARVLELLGPASLREKAFSRLISRDPQNCWTSGQWMTERTGGSDVSDTSTIARKTKSGYALYGTKWFTSSVASEMALALARIEGAPAGSKGLSLFFVETRGSDGQLNHIEVLRLKEKLGTKALPTAELKLNGVPAVLLGEENQGVKHISTMLNITRLYNAVCSVAQIRRALALLGDYARKRMVFGKKMAEQPLFAEVYNQQVMQHVSGMVLTFSAAELLGHEELGQASEDQLSLLRLLTPLAKMFTGKTSVQTVSEVVESFGGAGYIEDTRIPVLLRDAQVFSIWEGPTNVLSLDVIRVLTKTNAGEVFIKAMEQEIAALKDLGPEQGRLQAELENLKKGLQERLGGKPEVLFMGARALAFSLSHLYAAVKLASWQQWAQKSRPQLASLLLTLLNYRLEGLLVSWPTAHSKGQIFDDHSVGQLT